MDIRSKARTLPEPVSDPKKLPKWNYDGSSTGQVPGEDSEVILYPHAIFKDPFRGGNNILRITEIAGVVVSLTQSLFLVIGMVLELTQTTGFCAQRMDAKVALYLRTLCKHLQIEAQVKGSDAAMTTGTEATVYAFDRRSRKAVEAFFC